MNRPLPQRWEHHHCWEIDDLFPDVLNEYSKHLRSCYVRIPPLFNWAEQLITVFIGHGTMQKSQKEEERQSLGEMERSVTFKIKLMRYLTMTCKQADTIRRSSVKIQKSTNHTKFLICEMWLRKCLLRVSGRNWLKQCLFSRCVCVCVNNVHALFLQLLADFAWKCSWRQKKWISILKHVIHL